MTADFLPLRLLLATLAGRVNRHQQQVIDYLIEENRAIREQFRGRRVRLSDDQRRRLAAKGQRLGRRVLRQVATIVIPPGNGMLHSWGSPHTVAVAHEPWRFAREAQGRP